MPTKPSRPITLLDAVLAVGDDGAYSDHIVIADSSYTIDITGAPTAVTVDIEGSFDGVTFFQIASHAMDAAELSAAKAMFHISGKPVLFIQANLTVLTAGTAPSVTVKMLK